MEICPLAGNKTKVPAMPSLAVFLCPGWWNRGLNLLMRNQWVHGKNPEAPLLLLCHSFIPPTHTPSLFLSRSLYPAFSSHFRLHCVAAFWHISQNLLYCDKHHMSSFEIKIRVAYLLYWPIFTAEIQSFEGVCVCVCLCWKWCFNHA